MRTTLACIGVIAVAALGATTGSSAPPQLPAKFVARVTNPWFPLTPGTTYRYTGTSGGEPAREVFTVARNTKVIQGVRCTVVHDGPGAVAEKLYVRGIGIVKEQAVKGGNERLQLVSVTR
jgi:hypothetical protein